MDATLKAKTCGRLISEIDQMPPRLQLAAKYIVDNSVDFGLDPIRVTAEKIGASSNTLVRLADRLGFGSFDELREPFRKALLTTYDSSESNNWLERMSSKDEVGQTQATAAKNELNIVGRSLQLLTTDKADAAVTAMINARDVYVTATRASYAMAYFFHYVGRMALPNLQLIPRHMGSPLDEMIEVDETDVLLAITFPPYSAETIKALKLAKSRGAKVILISDSELIAPNIKVDLFLQVSAHSTHQFGCFAGALAVLECLLAHLFRNGGEDAKARISAYQGLREDFGAYWKAKVPKIHTGRGKR